MHRRAFVLGLGTLLAACGGDEPSFNSTLKPLPPGPTSDPTYTPPATTDLTLRETVEVAVNGTPYLRNADGVIALTTASRVRIHDARGRIGGAQAYTHDDQGRTLPKATLIIATTPTELEFEVDVAAGRTTIVDLQPGSLNLLIFLHRP